MKKLLLALLVGLLFPLSTSAHLANQPPFVYVNDQPAAVYPVGYASLPDLKLPQDIDTTNRLLADRLHFRLDTGALPIFPEELTNITFHWDFGDGTTLTGTEVDHQFSSIGSKVVNLTTTDSRTPTAAPQLLDAVYVTILPDANYRLPQPIIEINGMRSTDIVNDILKADFTKKVVLDGTKSVAGSAQIATYTWDLGNRAMSKDAKNSINYDPIFSTVIPVLRVTDKNGFYVDTTVQVENSTLAQSLENGGAASVPAAPEKRPAPWVYYVIGGLGLAALVALFWRRRSSNYNPNPRKYHHR